MDQVWWLDMPLQAPPRINGLGIGVIENTVPRSYRLPGLWCLHLYRWRGAVTIDGRRVPIRPGHAGICPPAERLDYELDEPALHVYAHFDFPRADGPPVPMPALVDLGPAFERVYSGLQEAVAWRHAEPPRAACRLWETLWEIRAIVMRGMRRGGDALARAREHIELRLTEPLSVVEIAAHAGCSHNHLIRLFRRSLGTTVVGYIRARRAERARHLLERSDAAIKEIAAEIGVADLARFNKLVRRELGRSPRGVREAAAGRRR
jgi:AraC-like DNA-binding protein